MELDKLKIIACFIRKGKTLDNTPCKLKVFMYDNGILIIQKFILVPEEYSTRMFFHKLTTKFGHSLLVSEFSFRYSTLINLHKTANKIIKENIDNFIEII
jgi:hypothetical protein